MRLRFHGVRGSIAAPGPSTVRYGGNTVCVEARLVDGSVLILDGGTGMRELGKALMQEEHDAPLHLLLTHLHWDHIMGIPFFAPLYRKGTLIHIHPMMNELQQDAVRRRTIFDGIHFPVSAADIPAHLDLAEHGGEESWRIGSAVVRRIALNHPGGAQGFRIDDDGGKSIAYLTDNELSPPGPNETSLDELARFAQGVDVLIHDAQYLAEDMPEKRGWGHSTVDDVLTLGQKAGTPHLVLFHHDPERDDDALDALGFHANDWLKQRKLATKASVAREGWSFEL